MAPWVILALSSFVAPSVAQSNGMNMQMDMPMDLAEGNMLPYLHFRPGDSLWFLGWVPKSAGGMVAACIGLFLLSILERWVAACLGLAERHWVDRTRVVVFDKTNNASRLPHAFESPKSSSTKNTKWLPLVPFVLEVDITRGVLFGAQTFLKVFLMMAGMTFQLAFIASIAIGSGVGETLFGRFVSLGDIHEH